MRCTLLNLSLQSEPKQIYSGDIVQFGVEIVENSNKGENRLKGIVLTVSYLMQRTSPSFSVPSELTRNATITNFLVPFLVSI